MKWSWKIGEYAGIGVYIHATFLLIIGWVLFSHLLQGANLSSTIGVLAFVLIIFVCVILHEFGHALMAKRFGIKTRDITLLPIGGVARLEKMPEKPKEELLVALAGPAVNMIIALALLLWIILTQSFVPLNKLGVASGSFIERLLVVNIFLGVFNLIPAFPMDGGRVLRAILAYNMSYTKATHIAAVIGQGIALIFGFIGLFINPILVFIAFFVWIGASQESSMVQMKSALGGIPVNRAMITDYKVVLPVDNLSKVIDLILSGSQQDFPVVANNQVVGILTQKDLLIALSQKDKNTTVVEIMQEDYQYTHPLEMLDKAFEKLQGCSCLTMPVIQDGKLQGLLTRDNIGEFIMIQSALGKKH